MKKIFLSLLAVAGLVSAASAQDLRVNTYFGGNFADTFAETTGNGLAGNGLFFSNISDDVEISGGFAWGIGVEKKIKDGVYAELSYFFQKNNLEWNQTAFDNTAMTSYSHKYSVQQYSNYVMVGANKYFREDCKLQPFVGAQLGMNILSIGNALDWKVNDDGNITSGSSWLHGPNGQFNTKQEYLNYVYNGSRVKFAWGVRAGANYQLNDRFALKFQAALLSSVGVYSNSAPDTENNRTSFFSGFTSFRPSTYQVNLTGGLVMNLNNLNLGSKKSE